MKIWDMEESDVVRFVLRRSEWATLVKALASASVWGRGEDRDLPWQAMDVLRNAEVDIDASELVRALNRIAEMTVRTDGSQAHLRNQIQIIHAWATRPERMKTEAEQATEVVTV